MTSKKKLETATKSAPVELHDEALDKANGGILIGLLLPAVQKIRAGSATDGSGISDGTSNTIIA